MTDPVVTVGWALIRAAIGLVVFGFALEAVKTIEGSIADLRENWQSRDTYPYPDEQATQQLRLLLTRMGLLAFLFGAGILYIAWVLGWVAWHP